MRDSCELSINMGCSSECGGNLRCNGIDPYQCADTDGYCTADCDLDQSFDTSKEACDCKLGDSCGDSCFDTALNFEDGTAGSCCGDDENEYYIINNLIRNMKACCDADTDCVDASGNCMDDGNMIGFDVCIDGSWMPDTDGDGIAIDHCPDQGPTGVITCQVAEKGDGCCDLDVWKVAGRKGEVELIEGEECRSGKCIKMTGDTEYNAGNPNQFTDTTDGDLFLIQEIYGLKPGKTYLLSVWLKGNVAADGTIRIMGYRDNPNHGKPVSNPGDWTLETTEYAPASDAPVSIRLETDSGTMYFDDISIIEKPPEGISPEQIPVVSPGPAVSLGSECCPSDYCWTGTECVDASLWEDDSQKRVIFDEGEEWAEHGFRCVYTDESAKTGAYWQYSKLKYSWEGVETGFCPYPSQCFVQKKADGKKYKINNEREENIECIEGGDYISEIITGEGDNPVSEPVDHYCMLDDTGEGVWTTRTAMIASAFEELKRDNDFTMHCDEKAAVVNKPDLDLPEGISDITSNICVIRYKEGGVEKTVIGLPLQDSTNAGQLGNVLQALGAAKTACDEEGADRFEECGSDRVWWNDQIDTMFYAKDGIDLTTENFNDPGWWQWLSGLIITPFTATQNIIESSFSTDIIVPQDFARLYKMRSTDPERRIEGIISGDYISIKYTGFTSDIEEAVEGFDQTHYAPPPPDGQQRPAPPDVRETQITDNGDLIIYEPSASGLLNWLWPDLTAKLRVTDCTNGIQDGDETGVDCGGSCAECSSV
ncbi:MAG: hypothetical protein ABH879_10135 [archaeon]